MTRTRLGILALELATLTAFACGGRTPFDGASGAMFDDDPGAGGSNAGGSGTGGASNGGATGTGGTSTGSGGRGGSQGAGGTAVGGSPGSGGTAVGGASGVGGAPGTGGAAGRGGAAGASGGGTAGRGGAAGTGGSSTGGGAGSTDGGAGGGPGGISRSAVIALLARPTPECVKCAEVFCGRPLDSCAADGRCVSGLACGVRCGEQEVGCRLACFDDLATALAAGSAFACVHGRECAPSCGSIPNL